MIMENCLEINNKRLFSEKYDFQSLIKISLQRARAKIYKLV